MISNWWLSSSRMTVMVSAESGIITKTPPIVRKFIGQPLASLVGWMTDQGDIKVTRLDDDQALKLANEVCQVVFDNNYASCVTKAGMYFADNDLGKAMRAWWEYKNPEGKIAPYEAVSTSK